MAALLRRSRNAKSARDSHDTAYFAWEASVRLAVLADPPGDISSLSRASVGQLVALLRGDDARLAAPELLAVHGLLTEIGTGRRSTPRSVSVRGLLADLPAFRNRVVGHGSVASGATYDYAGAAATLAAGLVAAWQAGVFLPSDARLVFVESVAIDAAGARRARILELSGHAVTFDREASEPPVAEAVLPGRVYVRERDAFRPLHPFVVFDAEELRETVYFLNSAGARPAYLDYVSGGHLRGAELDARFPALDAEVRAAFGSPKSDGRAAILPAPAAVAGDDQFGDYRIVGKLGEGGMGVVYLAAQAPLGRLVAIKMLPEASSRDPVAVARFRREAEALSRAEHPNVVTILTSGQLRGRHFYAMEYVEGADLGKVVQALPGSDGLAAAVTTAAGRDRQARTAAGAAPAASAPGTPPVSQVRDPGVAARTGRRDRADKFAELAAAMRDAALGLHHLHEAGIVHRDVKPANLMVTAADGRVVVMDLGLAAVSGDANSITRDKGQILGTLRYLSPEQLQRNHFQVDRRADIYSLGATFWELLAGRPMHDGDSEARLVEQVLREAPPSLRSVEPRVPEDLATIIRKATDKDPALRYTDAAALARDLDAFLEGRPIAARPPSAAYLIRLAVRRNRAAAATAAAGALALAAVTVAFVVGLGEERDRANQARAAAESARGAAVDARLRAEVESARADELASFMLGDLSEELRRAGRLRLMGKVARRALEHYQDSSAGAPTKRSELARATALATLTEVLRDQGDLPGALDAALACLAIRERIDADAGGDRTSAVGVLAAVEAVAEIRRAQGELDAALDGFHRALRTAEQMSAADPSDTAAALAVSAILADIGETHAARGDYAGALDALRRAEVLRRRAAEAAPDDPSAQGRLAYVISSIASVAQSSRDLNLAASEFERSLAIRRRVAAALPDDVDAQAVLAYDLTSLGTIRHARGESGRALELLDEAERVRRSALAADPASGGRRRDVAAVQLNRAAVLAATGRSGDALAVIGEVRAVAAQLEAADPSDVETQNLLCEALAREADILRDTGRFEMARDCLLAALQRREALAARDPSARPPRRATALVLERLAGVYEALWDDAAADDARRRSMQIREGLLGPGASREALRDATVSWRQVASALESAGDAAAARVLIEKSIPVLEQLATGPEASWTSLCDLAVGHTDLGRVALAVSDTAAAKAAYARAAALARDLEAGRPERSVVRQVAAIAARGVRHLRWIDGEATPVGAAEQADAGEAFSRAGQHRRALELLRPALADPDVAGDLDAGYLYIAAAAAARASAAAPPAERAVLVAEALRWLAANVGLERAAADSEGEAGRTRLAESLRWLEARDPAFAPIRAEPRFREIFAGPR